MKLINLFLVVVMLILLLLIFLVNPSNLSSKMREVNSSINSRITSKDILSSLSDPNPFAPLSGC